MLVWDIMVQHECCKQQTESEKEMKHITLKNETIIRSKKQVAAEFVKVHADQAEAKSDLETLKTIIKTNRAFDWLAHGIKLSMQPTTCFDKEGAINLLIKHGATEEEIADLTTKGQTPRVDLVKK